MKRVRRWTVKVSAADAARLAAAARRVGLPVAAFMRGAAMARAQAVEQLGVALVDGRPERLEKASLRNIVSLPDMAAVDGMTPRHDTETPTK